MELLIDNPEHCLKPGMFIRASVVLERVNDALIVPESALTRRNGQSGVFVIHDNARTVHWRPVEEGIHEKSFSEGRSRVRMSFAWGTDIDTAAIDVQAKLEDEINELPEDVIRPQAQRDLLAAGIAEVEAVVDYRIARVRLYQAEGSLLDRRGVSLAGAP